MLTTRRLIFSIFATALLGAVAVQAQIYRGGNEVQIRGVLTRLENKTDTFRSAVDRRSGNVGVNNPVNQADLPTYVAAFENATDRLRSSFNSRRSTTDEATEVLNRAWYIDNFIRQNRAGAAVERQWNSIRTELDQLSRYYSVAWNWNRVDPPFGRDRDDDRNTGGDDWRRGRFDNRITGTYRLNSSMSDDPRTAIDRALTGNVTDRQRQSLERRLSAPERLAIEVRGDSVQLGTNLAQPVSFTINGRVVSETNARGRTTRT